MVLIVGLGNPGKRFEHTRHNAGFLAVDLIAAELGIKVNKIKFKSLIGEGVSPRGNSVLLMKPQTFMNLSGEAVKAAAQYYRIPSEKIIVIYDDIDIPVGSTRIRPKGSAGTHNGMRNILYHLETEHFPRIRVGIAGERHGSELYDYVLSRFSKAEEELLSESLRRSAEAALLIVDDSVDQAMNSCNVTVH